MPGNKTRPPLENPAVLALVTIGVMAAVAGGERLMGREWFGPDGKFGWWEGSIWSSENSQRLADAYSFSHLTHGFLFYAGLWLVARKWPASRRFLVALLIEAAWEVLENSPLIINRYRHATISLGYAGDSVINSLSDIVFMAVGFWLARWAKLWVSVVAVVVMEVGCVWWVRDNLTLNVIMLAHPVEAIKQWQLEGQPETKPK